MLLTRLEEETMKVIWNNPKHRETVKRAIFNAFADTQSQVTTGHLSKMFGVLDAEYLTQPEEDEAQETS